MFMITGIAGDYMLDEHGDRDVVFSLIYTNTNNEVSNKSSTTPPEYTSFICQGNYGSMGIIYKATTLILTDSTQSTLVTGCNQFVLSAYVPFSVLQYKVLYEFDTTNNKTTLIDRNPSFIWSEQKLPDDRLHVDKGAAAFLIQLLLLLAV